MRRGSAVTATARPFRFCRSLHGNEPGKADFTLYLILAAHTALRDGSSRLDGEALRAQTLASETRTRLEATTNHPQVKLLGCAALLRRMSFILLIQPKATGCIS